MASIRGMNANAEIVSKHQALMVNVSAAKGLQGVLKSNLGMLYVKIPPPFFY
jgi:T-complex protein 1 subunit zeta